MTDIVDRIRDIAIHADLTQVQQDCLYEASDTIEQLRKLEGLVESQRSLIAAYQQPVSEDWKKVVREHTSRDFTVKAWPPNTLPG